jgi:hypothetical protein
MVVWWWWWCVRLCVGVVVVVVVVVDVPQCNPLARPSDTITATPSQPPCAAWAGRSSPSPHEAATAAWHPFALAMHHRVFLRTQLPTHLQVFLNPARRRLVQRSRRCGVPRAPFVLLLYLLFVEPLALGCLLSPKRHLLLSAQLRFADDEEMWCNAGGEGRGGGRWEDGGGNERWVGWRWGGESGGSGGQMR